MALEWWTTEEMKNGIVFFTVAYAVLGLIPVWVAPGQLPVLYWLPVLAVVAAAAFIQALVAVGILKAAGRFLPPA